MTHRLQDGPHGSLDKPSRVVKGPKRATARLKHSKPHQPRSEAYMAWVRKQPCVVCARLVVLQDQPTEAAHVNDGTKGLGMKVSDFRCLPLCGLHHRTSSRALDRVGNDSFEMFINAGRQEHDKHFCLDGEIGRHLIRYLGEQG